MAVCLAVETCAGPDSRVPKLETALEDDGDGVVTFHTPPGPVLLAHGTSFPALAPLSDPPPLVESAKDKKSEALMLSQKPTIVGSMEALELAARAATPCSSSKELERRTKLRHHPSRTFSLAELHLRTKLYSGNLRAVQHIPWPAKFLPCRNARELESYVLYRQKSKQAPSRGHRLLKRIPLARVARPVEYFNGRTELIRVFRDYFQTIISLFDEGLDHRNISLESLSIVPTSKGLSGMGIIASYDEKPDSSRLGEGKPCFIYTMPCRITYNDCPTFFGHHDSLQSLLLCLIWIVTTHSGSHNNERRAWGYRFSITEISQWNKKVDVDNDPDALEFWKKKMLVMLSEKEFEERILFFVHSHFKEQKIFLQVLRTLIYDPQWCETRRLLADPDTADSDGRKTLVEDFMNIIEDGARLNESALERALGKPGKSNKATSIGGNDRTVEMPINSQAGWDAPALAEYKKTVSPEQLKDGVVDALFCDESSTFHG